VGSVRIGEGPRADDGSDRRQQRPMLTCAAYSHRTCQSTQHTVMLFGPVRGDRITPCLDALHSIPFPIFTFTRALTLASLLRLLARRGGEHANDAKKRNGQMSCTAAARLSRLRMCEHWQVHDKGGGPNKGPNEGIRTSMSGDAEASATMVCNTSIMSASCRSVGERSGNTSRVVALMRKHSGWQRPLRSLCRSR
jgi:hypothetical protein